MKLALLPLLTLGLSCLLPSSLALPSFNLGDQDLLNNLISRIQAADPALVQNVFTELGKAVEELKDQIPQAPESLINADLGSLSTEAIYQAFNLTRTQSTSEESSYKNITLRSLQPLNRREGIKRMHTKRASLLGWKLTGPAEDAQHPYIKPGPKDHRGPCPGLNTLANHGYLPRNGIVNPLELLWGTFNGLNLSPDLAAILGAVSFVVLGDLTSLSLSIGGKYKLGSGLSHHGVLEGDASITRQDNYFGNSWSAQPKLVEQFIGETNKYGNGNVNVYSLGKSRFRAWDFSRKNNPNFDFNPWRMLVAYAESGFVHEVLRGNNLKFDEPMIRRWFLEERFPKGWSKRIVPFSTPEILAWAAVIEAAGSPTTPGWSLGVKGAFIPIPTFKGLTSFFGSLLNGGSSVNTVKHLGCNVANAFLGFFPTGITNLFGNLGLHGVGSTLNCK